VIDEIQARIPTFSPAWSPAPADLDDSGLAFLQLFGEQMEPVIQRVNRLPQKAQVEALRIAGLDPMPATPASVLLEFTILESAPGSAFIQAGFQVGGRATGGSGNLIIFESQDDLYATPAKIVQRQVQEGTLFRDLGPPTGDFAPFQLFGDLAEAGRALYLGLSGPAPQSQLTIGIEVEAPAGLPPPVASGGPLPLPVRSAPILSWEIYDGSSLQFVPVTLLKDETGGLVQGGLVVLGLPATWRAAPLPPLDPRGALRWVRLRIVQGRYERPPALLDLRLNLARALAVHTIVAEPVDSGPDPTNQRTAQLSQVPVVPGSLTLTVLDSALSGSGATTWQETRDLGTEAPDAKVYELDPGTGVLEFGDGVHGAAIPPGFRNVLATYKAVSDTGAGGIDAQAVSVLLTSAPFVTGVSNPRPASGGSPLESQDDAIRRGPQVLRARGRAVTEADFELLALQAPGARVLRAHAIAGRHPSYPGHPIPGVVGVFIVPPDPGTGAPPVPTEEAHRAVATYLAQSTALAGVDVVAATPRYHYIRARAAVVMAPGGRALDVLDAITRYLHPIDGGADGQGWPFGATLAFRPLVLFLLNTVAGLRALPKLLLEVDGRQVPSCTDIPIEDDALFWSLRHEIIPTDSDSVGQP
jgi:predicted phage baseplate assembly protein